MADKIDDGGAAFPQLSIESGEHDGHGDLMDPITASEGGMSLRDYFAASALQGALINSPSWESPQDRAQRAYALADAMLEARKP